jgi:hypothetical protein
LDKLFSMTHALSLGPNDEAKVRMPSAAERHVHHLAPDEPVIEIRRQDGIVEIHGAHRTRVAAQRSPHANETTQASETIAPSPE